MNRATTLGGWVALYEGERAKQGLKDLRGKVDLGR